MIRPIFTNFGLGTLPLRLLREPALDMSACVFVSTMSVKTVCLCGGEG